jgi:hypothetical protein
MGGKKSVGEFGKMVHKGHVRRGNAVITVDKKIGVLKK